MRFCLQFAVRCCSISAIAIAALLGSSVDAVQFAYGPSTGTSQIGAYGSAPAGAQNQNYATSRPYQSDPAGSNYQSMSPDSWGNPGALRSDPLSDPFSSPRPAAPFNNSATAAYGQRSQSGPSRQNAPAPYAYGQAPSQNPAEQYQAPAYAGQSTPRSQYESTGAPSVQTLLGGQNAQQPTVPNRSAAPSPFRPADFDSRDPKDIPLAPTVPANILQLNNNRLDATSSDGRYNTAFRNVSTTVPQTGIELDLLAEQLPTEEKVIPDLLQRDNSILGKVELPENPLPQNDFPSSNQQPGSTTRSPAASYPTTQAQPFSNPSPAASYPTTQAQPFSNPSPANSYPSPTNSYPSPTNSYPSPTNSYPSPTNSYPSTNAQPFIPPTQVQAAQVPPAQVPLAPYQLPQVFGNVQANAPALAPANAVPQTNAVSGFGWGNAPGITQRNLQPSPTLPPQAALQVQPKSKPAFPLPFGLGSKLFRKRSDQKNLPLDFSQPDSSEPKRSLFGGQKQVDPNTYPPQPVPHSQAGPFQQGAFPAQMPNAQFRPDLAQRAPLPTVRNTGTYDSGKTEYDFENKKREFPPFSEILATGRWFGSFEAQVLKPRFNGNSGLAILDQTSGNNFTDSQVFDFDFEFVPSLRLGFESKYGPGFEFDYRDLSATSDLQSFTSGAATSASLRAVLPDVSLSSVISTTAPGQTLSGDQRLSVESFSLSVFKEVQLPVTRINGMFGFQAVDIDHVVDATVTDGAGTVLQTLNSSSDMRAFGPRIRIEYFRPVGHTKLEFLTRFGGSLLFGKRDQLVVGEDSFQRVGTDEIVTTVEFLTALQIKQRIGENRSVFGRIGYLNESFNGGGSGFLAQDDFGLRGITFLVGINR